MRDIYSINGKYLIREETKRKSYLKNALSSVWLDSAVGTVQLKKLKERIEIEEY